MKEKKSESVDQKESPDRKKRTHLKTAHYGLESSLHQSDFALKPLALAFSLVEQCELSGAIDVSCDLFLFSCFRKEQWLDFLPDGLLEKGRGRTYRMDT